MMGGFKVNAWEIFQMEMRGSETFGWYTHYTVKKHRVKNLTVFDGKWRRRLVEVACTDDAGRD